MEKTERSMDILISQIDDEYYNKLYPITKIKNIMGSSDGDKSLEERLDLSVEAIPISKLAQYSTGINFKQSTSGGKPICAILFSNFSTIKGDIEKTLFKVENNYKSTYIYKVVKSNTLIRTMEGLYYGSFVQFVKDSANKKITVYIMNSIVNLEIICSFDSSGVLSTIDINRNLTTDAIRNLLSISSNKIGSGFTSNNIVKGTDTYPINWILFNNSDIKYDESSKSITLSVVEQKSSSTKINKLYPITRTDNVYDPESKKTIKELFNELPTFSFDSSNPNILNVTINGITKQFVAKTDSSILSFEQSIAFQSLEADDKSITFDTNNNETMQNSSITFETD